jgi:hypothetical protein
MRTIRYGGQIEKGDFLIISYQNCIGFGWYIGEGKGTIHFYNLYAPKNYNEAYESYLKETKHSKWSENKYEKGFNLKSVYKDYIYDTNEFRIAKVNNPEEFFTNPNDFLTYEQSRDVLIKLKFIK